MTANIITVIAVVAGIAWLAVLFVSAVRNRGREEISPNLKPPTSDEEMETRRLETAQKAAIAFSAFLAISLPLYFLGEPDRQQGFVEQFDEESVERGAHLVEEFLCFNCHGPEGVGASSSYVEKRSGVTTAWAAPPLNDVLYRYDRDEVNFWITFGRGNTPMPAWGLAGGGPLNEEQVVDVVNYLETIQIPQTEAVNRVPDPVQVELDKLANADVIMAAAIVTQDQVVHEIMRAPDDVEFLEPRAARARDILDAASDGIDTDDDGLSDASEVALSALSAEILEGFVTVELVALDPAVSDAQQADNAVANLESALETDPIVISNLEAVRAALTEGTVVPGGLSSPAAAELQLIAVSAGAAGIDASPGPFDTHEAAVALVATLEEAAAAADAPPEAAMLAGDAAAAIEDGSDPDDDGLSTGAERTITNQMADAHQKTIPSQVVVMTLDPTNPESGGGQPDAQAASAFVGNIESLATSLRVSTNNQAALLRAETAGLAFLEAAALAKSYEIDIAGVAAAMGVDEEQAARAVGLFNANCARCHTAGYSAGLAFTQEAGSGGFGPALWDGRPVVQFGELGAIAEEDLLGVFLTRGSEAQKPYGLNGFGSGRMPAFGAVLPIEDIQLLAVFLRAGNLDGKG